MKVVQSGPSEWSVIDGENQIATGIVSQEVAQRVVSALLPRVTDTSAIRAAHACWNAFLKSEDPGCIHDDSVRETIRSVLEAALVTPPDLEKLEEELKQADHETGGHVFQDQCIYAAARAYLASQRVTRESQMVPVALSDGTTGHCDPDIQSIVQAINDAGHPTVASCSGHGFQPTRISLKDGREVMILNYEQAKRVSDLFPDINGRVTENMFQHLKYADGQCHPFLCNACSYERGEANHPDSGVTDAVSHEVRRGDAVDGDRQEALGALESLYSMAWNEVTNGRCSLESIDQLKDSVRAALLQPPVPPPPSPIEKYQAARRAFDFFEQTLDHSHLKGGHPYYIREALNVVEAMLSAAPQPEDGKP